MKKVTVIGHFGFGLEYLDGQTIKTKILAEELERRFGEAEVIKIDTHGGVKALIKAPFQVVKAFHQSKNIIMLPAHNGLLVYGRLLAYGKKIFQSRKIHYAVIGGWLSSYLTKRKGLSKCLRNFDGIYVETNTMRNALKKQGFDNLYVMPNCKKLTILSDEQLVYSIKEPYKLCTFSRVTKEKGIEDAINAVKYVNEKCGRVIYTLDIYGQIDSAQTEWFENIKNSFPEYINYGGLVPFDKSVEVLKDYFALLFPTRFYTEGIPGTIIDAYAAGIPVISSKWESFEDIIDDGVTGTGYEFNNLNHLQKILLAIVNDEIDINALKCNCNNKAMEFSPERAMEVLVKELA